MTKVKIKSDVQKNFFGEMSGFQHSNKLTINLITSKISYSD